MYYVPEKQLTCPACEEPITHLSGLAEHVPPSMGDYFVCTHCASPILVGTDHHLSVVPLTVIQNNPQLLALTNMVADIRLECLRSVQEEKE